MTLTLLDPEAFPRVDEAQLRQTLAFAFATGDVGDALLQVPDTMALSPTSWEPKDFVRDVFLDTLVDRCFSVVIGGKSFPRSHTLLRRILSAPPKDPAVARFRQEICRELAGRKEIRAAAEKLYVELVHLRGLLTKTTATRVDPFERRLAVLRALRDVTLIADGGLATARSGLSRVAAWAKETRKSPGFLKLLELLAYEDGAAEIDVRLRLGFDGKVRHLAIVGKRATQENAFHKSPGGLFATRVGLFLRGYDFSVHELFSRLADEVFDGVTESFLPLFPLIGDLEFYLGSLRFMEGARAAGLEVSLPSFDEGQGHLLEELFNPLLVSEAGRAVPCDIATSATDSRVIVTGPNSGGKTRLLQAIALTQILGQAGTFVPAARARIPWSSGLFVSIIEQAHADAKEGRLGTELLRIRRLFESLRTGSLVVLDELCSGTNPSEGEEIFRLVIGLLGELRPAAFITTHFLAFAHRLEEERQPLAFLQVELDREERPTYRFVPGVATTSLAHKTALRLGVTEEALRATILRNNPELRLAASQDADERPHFGVRRSTLPPLSVVQ